MSINPIFRTESQEKGGINRRRVIPQEQLQPDAGEATRREDSLPCLYSNNSIEITENQCEYSLVTALQNILTPYHKRAAETLHNNVARLIDQASSIDQVGFLTLTFVDNVTCHKVAGKRFDSFNSNFLKECSEFGHWVRVLERQRRGAWHYHLLIHTSSDIRTGFDFEEYLRYQKEITPGLSPREKRRLNRLACRSASPELRKLWSLLRRILPKYGFGRSELLPIRTNKDGMARYLGKYISKNIGIREERDKGVRYVAYSQGWIKNSVKFAWSTDNSKEWRKKVEIFSCMVGCQDLYELSQKLGSDWAYKYAAFIYEIDANMTPEKQWEYCQKAKPYYSPALRMLEKRVYLNWCRRHFGVREKNGIKIINEPF